MARDTRLGPDPSKAGFRAAQSTEATAEDASLETDFAALAARFSAKSGGGLSLELSAELALEIVLNEIVEQACSATGATGAAVVLRRGGEMVCRASSGLTAPELGSRLDVAFGLSGECIRTRLPQHCDDVLEDQRVDREAAHRLGVRSVRVIPLLRGSELAGVFEVFSSQPSAFGEQAQQILETLEGRIISSLDRAEEPSASQAQPVPAPELVGETVPGVRSKSGWGGFDLLTWALGIAIVACAVLLGILIGRPLRTRGRAERPYSVPSRNSAEQVSNTNSAPAEAATANEQTGNPVPSRQSVADGRTLVPEGSLLVFENGKEVFRMPGAQGEGSKSPVKLSPVEVQSGLIHRVEPEYPKAARQAGIQGAVVLDVSIGSDGAVQNVQLVSGPDELAQASIDAVKQWRFRPHRVAGRSTNMQAAVTLNFRLPR